MSIHNKMSSDYLWVRHAPIEEGVKFRHHGFNYLYNRAPNRVERLQMIYRSMGKQYDWEMEKFRAGRKPIDRGNKKRLLRNMVRFIKHPVGYLSTKTARWNLASYPRGILVLFAFSILGAFYEWKTQSNQISAYDDLLLSYGKNIEGRSGRYTGFHSTNMLRSPTFFDMLFRVPITPDKVIINQTWKQNLRKELQLTNSYNVQF